MKREKIEKFLKLAKNYNLFDVRSPGEFAKGHIPNALNLPLVEDDERVEVGTLYVQHSEQEAYLKGLEIIGPKLHRFARTAIEKSIDRKILLYCFRGGKRSESMAWLFELVGLKAIVLEGGYKSFRNYIRKFFKKIFHFIVIGGYTGSGKTRILQKLAEQGQQVLDLEGLVNHKGSVFGSIGMGEQPHYESFENALFQTLQSFDPDKVIFVEDESRHIGKLLIPVDLFSQLTGAPIIIIEKSLDNRINGLKKDYLSVENAILIEYVTKIQKRLGSQRTKDVIFAIQEGYMEYAIKEVLFYYDKAYQRTVDQRDQKKLFIKSDDESVIIEQILKITEEV